MRPLRAIRRGAYCDLERYGIAPDVPIPPLLRGLNQAADSILRLAREVRSRRDLDRRARLNVFRHLRRAWIGHAGGNLALGELEFERAWTEAFLRHSPLAEIAGEKVLADQRRKFALLKKNRARNQKLRELGKQGLQTDTLRQRFDLSPRQTRRLRNRKP